MADPTPPVSTVVVLEPPYTRSGCNPYSTLACEPVWTGPPLVRTRAMSRWHRTRSGLRFHPNRWHADLRIAWGLWCGQAVSSTQALTAAAVPADELLCATCEGRAVGAGHPALGIVATVPLVFTPASQYKRPAACPGASSYLLPSTPAGSGREAACLVCGEVQRVRACGGPYNPDAKLTGHAPGPGLVEPCVFHGWQCVRPNADRTRAVVCVPPPLAPADND